MNHDERTLTSENALNRANGAEFALRLYEINRNNGKIDLAKFREGISRSAFAIIAFLEIDADTTERTRAVDIALRITETYNRSFPESRQPLDEDGLFALAKSVLNFMRHEATIIR